MACSECYSDDPRVTPILKAEKCLMTHRQYVCSTCGRCICAEVNRSDRFRARFPFRTLEIAKLYLRSAEAIYQGPCEIYEVEYKNGRVFYKIFQDIDSLMDYLKNNPEEVCKKLQPLFRTPNYLPPKSDQLRRLSKEEVATYLEEKGKTIYL